MKKASIVTIGNELLSGETIDTNAACFSRELLAIGMPVASAFTAADEQDAIVRALKLACEDADVVVATGGLGPTDDDITRQAFAKFVGVELEIREELLRKMEAFFARRNLKMPDKNRIQAYIPAGSDALPNSRGTAAGIMVRVGEKLLIALPGVPSEAKEMFARYVLPDLRGEVSDQAVVVRKLNCYGAGESTIAEMLGDMMQRGRNPLINCNVSLGVITLHIVATAK
ncbi:MAG: competence/damage-inducible protein A, partial [Planctomycetota bacterium]